MCGDGLRERDLICFAQGFGRRKPWMAGETECHLYFRHWGCGVCATFKAATDKSPVAYGCFGTRLCSASQLQSLPNSGGSGCAWSAKSCRCLVSNFTSVVPSSAT